MPNDPKAPLSDVDDPSARMCLVCGRKLEEIVWTDKDIMDPAVHEDSLGFRHALQHQPEDHAPIPVRVSDAPKQFRGHCDFCNAEHPTWAVPAKDFAATPDLGNGKYVSMGGWAACDKCATMIRRNQWNALLKRAAQHSSGDAHLNYMLLAPMYYQLRKAVTGPPIRIQY